MKTTDLIFAAFFFTCCVANAANTKPDVLFIAVDDQNDRGGRLGGHPHTRAPNIDRLAKSSMLFRNAHCPRPTMDNQTLRGPSSSHCAKAIAPAGESVFKSPADAAEKKRLRDEAERYVALPVAQVRWP